MKFTAPAAVATTAALALSACSVPEPEGNVPTGGGEVSADELLAEHGLDGLDPEEVVDRLDTMAVEERPTDLMASVQPGSLVLSDASEGPEGGQEAELDLPEDRFYLSMAPYVEHTHDCFFHSLTTCLGELRDEEIDVTITDDADDSVLVEETVQTFDNGFAGYWLPSGIDATVTVEHDEYSGSTRVSTGEEDPTCLTTLELD
ncbi:CueP family metal-binding protein [Nocardiopsis salina]|uniref:CueP family metal-binding protein n=1 Tax=Nocardiopsis salina TaxID=245836 RepID=UPI000347C079|nr:CueP family metal-binding protein [Nocardiopsis salina]